MNRIPKTIGLGWSLLATFTLAADTPKPVVIDHTSAALRNVASRFWAAEYSPDGKTIAVTGGWDNPKEPGELVLWDVNTKAPTLIWRQDSPIRCAAFSDDNKRVAIGDFSGMARILDTQSGEVLLTLPNQEKIVNSLVFIHDGQTLITGCFNETVTFWNTSTGAQEKVFSTPDEGITTVTVSPDELTLVATTWPGNVHAWDLNKNSKSFDIAANDKGLIAEGMDFSPNGKNLAIGSWDASLKIWNIENGELLRSLSGHSRPVGNVKYSPDGSLLASSDGKGEVRFWNPESGENLGVLKAHSHLCFGLDFSPNGQHLVTASWDRQIIIWNVKTRQLAATLLRADH